VRKERSIRPRVEGGTYHAIGRVSTHTGGDFALTCAEKVLGREKTPNRHAIEMKALASKVPCFSQREHSRENNYNPSGRFKVLETEVVYCVRKGVLSVRGPGKKGRTRNQRKRKIWNYYK